MLGKLLSVLKQDRVKNFFFFSSASFISAFIGIITLPLFTHYLAPEQFGIWSFVLTFNTFIGTIIVLDLHSYYLIVTSKGEKDKKEVLNTLLTFSFAWSCMSILLFTLLGFLFFHVLFKGISFYPFIFYIILSNLFLCFTLFIQIIYRVENKPVYYFLFSIFQSLCSIFISLYVVMYFLHDSEGRILGYSIGLLISGFVAFFIIKIKYSFRFKLDRDLIRKALKFSAPLIPYSIAMISMDFLDRVYIEKYCSITEMGLFGLANQINTVIYFVFISLIRVYEPTIIKWLGNRELKKLNGFSHKYNFLLLVAIAVLMCFSALIVQKLTNEKYLNSIDIIIKLSPFFYFKTLTLLLITILISSFKTYKSMYISLILLFLYLATGFYFIPTYGMDGMILIKTIISLVGCMLIFVFIGSYKQYFKLQLSFVIGSILVFLVTFAIYKYKFYL